MVMMAVLTVVFACFSTLFVGAAGRYVAGVFTDQRGARIAGFAAAIGYAVARYSFTRPVGVNITAPLLSVLGAVIGAAVLWFILFRSKRNAEAA